MVSLVTALAVAGAENGPGEVGAVAFDLQRAMPTGYQGTLSAAVLLLAATAAAQVVLPDRVAHLLARDTPAAARLTLHALELEGGEIVDLELERFEVWAEGAAVSCRSDGGATTLPPPRDRYFRGTVRGEERSFVFLAAGRTVRGFIATASGWYAVAPAGDAYRPGGDRRLLLRRFDPDRDRPPGAASWSCANDMAGLGGPALASAEAAGGGASALASSTVYAATLAIETDYELYQLLGSPEAVAAYVGDLVAASSAIYLRDVKTVLRIGALYTYATPADPYSATTLDGALFELGDYWHANRSSVPRSTVHLLSGKRLGGGIAWLGVICDGDFYYGGHWGGGYGVSTSLNGAFSATNPSLYWDLLCFSHELGHNFNSEHTHCYSPPVDTCYSGESGCYSGPTSVPPEKGTIMSYCHLRSGGYSNVKLFFGVPGEANERVLDVIRTYVEGRAACLSVVSPPPTVTAVTPSSGPVIGGTPITVEGSGFSAGATVAFGGEAATGVAVVGATLIQATTPPHGPGLAAVTVTNLDGQAATLAGAFTFVDCHVTVSNRTFDAPEEVTSPCDLMAGPSVHVTAVQAEVAFRAGHAVILRNGFAVRTGAHFVAGVDGLLLDG